MTGGLGAIAVVKVLGGKTGLSQNERRDGGDGQGDAVCGGHFHRVHVSWFSVKWTFPVHV